MTTDPAPASRRPRWRWLLLGLLWLGSLVVAARGWAFVLEKEQPIRRRLGLLPKVVVLQTNLYPLALERVPLPEEGRYGAIAAVPEGILWASRDGTLRLVDSARTVRPVALRVPINVAEFAADPFNVNTVEQDIFAVRDLLVVPGTDGLRLVASHNQWDVANDCFFLRVSVVDLPGGRFDAAGEGAWRTLFDSRPCLPLGLQGDGTRVPTIGAGGRLERFSEREVVLSVGTFVNDAAMTGQPDQFAGDSAHYGKTVVVDLETGVSRIHTRGHRNPQGLAMGPDGRLWSTEHAARGGDELNLLAAGADFGYPHVSYGTSYGTLDWPIGPATGRHEGYVKPTYAWVPSIGASQLVVSRDSAFARWSGDLLVSSLAAQTLFRVRVEDGRTIYAEPIPVGHRLRDVIETGRGAVALLTEDGFLILVSPLSLDAEDPGLIPRERGQLVAMRCQGCHTLVAGGAHGLGPNLHGIVGRRVGSASGFRYSQALASHGGRWSEEALRAFLADPSAAVPGTTMAMGVTLSATEIDNLLAYLRTLR